MDGSRLVQDFRLEIEVSFSVVIRDILHHLMDEVHLALRKFSVLYVLSKKVAEDSAEVLMTRIRQEASRISKHSHETTEKTEGGKRIHLLC